MEIRYQIANGRRRRANNHWGVRAYKSHLGILVQKLFWPGLYQIGLSIQLAEIMQNEEFVLYFPYFASFLFLSGKKLLGELSLAVELGTAE